MERVPLTHFLARGPNQFSRLRSILPCAAMRFGTHASFVGVALEGIGRTGTVREGDIGLVDRLAVRT